MNPRLHARAVRFGDVAHDLGQRVETAVTLMASVLCAPLLGMAAALEPNGLAPAWRAVVFFAVTLTVAALLRGIWVFGHATPTLEFRRDDGDAQH